MDEWQRDIVQAAYREVVAQGKHPSADRILLQATAMWTHLRDIKIGEWAESTLRNTSMPRLAGLADKVANRLYELGIADDWETADADMESEAEWAAWGLACLRWHYRFSNGREPELGLDVAEVKSWLVQVEEIPVSSNPSQPSLFGL